MNVEYINTFVQGAQTVLNSVCGDNPALGKLFVKLPPYSCKAISIRIELKGGMRGIVIFTLDTPLACQIASKMMYGMPVGQMDEMSISAISELTNMISGTAATLLSGKGKIVDISTPAFKENALSGDFSAIRPGSKVVCVPLLFPGGEVFELDILIEE